MKPIPGFPGYLADEAGAIWSVKRKSPRRLRPAVDRDGYLKVNLIVDRARVENAKVHRLVCAAYHGPCPSGCVTRHLDGQRSNNRPNNLTWGSLSENYRDRIQHGTDLGGKARQYKLTDVQVRAIRALRRSGQRIGTIANQFGVSRMTVGRIVNGHLRTRVLEDI